MQSNYAGYESVYQNLRPTGRLGWEDTDTAAGNLALLAEVLAAPHFPRVGRILELGCGAGDLALGLVAKGYTVSGVDIAPTAIEWARDKAREQGAEAEFQVGNVLNLAGYADSSFDIVVDGHCLHCIIGEDRAAFFAAARRVLKPGGLLHINTMCGDRFGVNFPDLYNPETRQLVVQGVPYRYISRPEDIPVEVQAAGFEIVHTRLALQPEGDADDLLVDARKPLI